MNSGEWSLSYLLFAEMLITSIRFRCRCLHGGVDWNTAVGDYKRNVPVAAFAGGMYAALRLCDLPPLCIFINQKQGYCILDAATLFSEKTVIGEQRYSADNVYRLSHIAMFVKSFPLKTAGVFCRTAARRIADNPNMTDSAPGHNCFRAKRVNSTMVFAEAALSSHIIK